MAFFRKSGPPAVPVPVDPNAEQFGYVQPPGEGSGFFDQYKYINRTNPNALMQLGAGMIAGDVAGGFSNAAQEMQQGADQQQRAKLALYGFNENLKKDNLTRQWLKQRFPDATEEELDAAIANPAILSELLAPPAKRNLIEVDGKLYDADTGEWITPEAGAGGGFDLGNSTDARALEFLVERGELTPIEAANVAAGKQITGADGAIYWKTPAGLVRQKPSRAPEAVDPNAPEPSPEEKQLTDPKPVTGTEGERRAQLLYLPTKRQENIALDNYDALSSKMGIATRIGEKIPGGIGDIVKMGSDYLTTPEYQQARNAVKTIYTNWLYATSGATATPSEQETQADLLMPRPGEDKASVEGKKQQLRDYVEGINQAQGVLKAKPNRPKPAAVPQATWDNMTDEERAMF